MISCQKLGLITLTKKKKSNCYIYSRAFEIVPLAQFILYISITVPIQSVAKWQGNTPSGAWTRRGKSRTINYDSLI